MAKSDYTITSIVDALKELNIVKGDHLFIHSNIALCGKLDDAKTANDYTSKYLEAFLAVIGEEGTLIMPAFTYSYCNNEVYDKHTSKSKMGILAEALRTYPESKRSDDPNFSVVAIGKLAEHMTTNLSTHAFDQHSFWGKFHEIGGKIVSINFPYASTFIHYVEKVIDVDYRYDKVFYGKSLIDGELIESEAVHYVRSLDKEMDIPDGTKFDRQGRVDGIISVKHLGRGEIITFETKSAFNYIEEKLIENPYFLRKGAL